MQHPAREILDALRRLRLAAIVEGATLLALLGVAVPLKHVAGYPGAVSVLGPVHGLAFLAYLWLAVQVGALAGWKWGQMLRVVGAALVPFGGFLTARALRGQERSIAGETGR